ncbi:MAG: FAD-dependent oxidoreductase [Weeksellaceae bacterium]
MHIGIIGAGFTGLTAAHELQKQGHHVTIIEREPYPGGLAIGFKKDKWKWSLEKHYHHIFTSDNAIQTLGKEIGVDFIFKRPVTSTLINGVIAQLDSPLTLLKYGQLSINERVRMGATLAYLKYVANWQDLEHFTAHAWMQEKMGKRAYQMIWEPLLKAKFSTYYKDISLAWFGARIKARTTSLGYPTGGFQNFVDTLAKKIEKRKGVIHYRSTVLEVKDEPDGAQVSYEQEGIKQNERFDAVLVTMPNMLFSKIAPQLPADYIKKLQAFKGIGAVNMVLEFDKPFFDNGVYWLSICDKEYPFLAAVEHTNFVDTSMYNKTHLVYIGNYLPRDHEYFSKTPAELLKIYHPYIERLSPGYEKHLLDITAFHVPFAQPIVTKSFSKQILPIETPLPHIYLSNMQQVYPWDRGTNYAVEFGKKAAEAIMTKA